MIYLDPIMWKYTAGHVSHALRKDALISPDKLTFKVVDVGGHRLYAVLFEPQYTKSLMLSWGTPGIGISIRGAEQLVEKMDTMVEVPFESQDSPPAPTWTPEGPAHEALRERIVGFLRHGAIDLDKVKCQTKDVFLYPTGMAAVFCAKNLLQEYRPGLVNVELGIVFHNTHELLHEESPGGWKHVPKVDKEAIDGLEEWLEKQKSEGGGATFVIVEFPGNPTLDTPDLPRLMKLVSCPRLGIPITRRLIPRIRYATNRLTALFSHSLKNTASSSSLMIPSDHSATSTSSPSAICFSPLSPNPSAESPTFLVVLSC